MSRKAPILLHMVSIIFLLVSFACVLGVVQIVSSWNWLRAFNFRPDPIYLVFKNAFFTLAFLLAAAVLWSHHSWASLFGVVTTIFFTLWFWVDRVILTRNPLPFKEHLFALLATVVIDFLVLASLFLLHPYMKDNKYESTPAGN